MAELRTRRKEGHWMWFVFSQFAGLGLSEMARRYAISSLAEAKAYLAHPVLGDRLRECTRAVLDSGETVSTIFSYPDDLKFRSCMTLFAIASEGREPFAEALQRLFQGCPDHETRKLLDTQTPSFSISQGIRLPATLGTMKILVQACSRNPSTMTPKALNSSVTLDSPNF